MTGNIQGRYLRSSKHGLESLAKDVSLYVSEANDEVTKNFY